MPGVKKSQRETESIGTQQSSVPLISSHVAVLKMVVYQITLNLQKQNKTKQKQTFVLSYLRCVYVSSFYSWLSFFPSHSVPATMNFFLTLYKTVPLMGCIPDSPRSQASSRGETKDLSLFSSRDAYFLAPVLAS